ncbi:hypothetical protein FOZ62_021598 [Perkinsus olseni]|uniref:K Homology domain-containing protein n=1 Tax=Perkinsus olseni TaxID=32597 RepID=A0A7J6U0X6_PEROL|nr:hypothetical protein FOZ62_021598 [Perkinsus olseni]
MRIPQKAVGKAIGRGGETIKRLKDELSTFVQVDQTTSEQGFSTFKISGSTDESVEAAVSYLKGVVLSCEPCECLYPDDVEDEVEVPADKVGTVIGPQGCVLDEIRRRSGCRVQLQPVAVEDGSPRSAKVVGNADAVRACVDLLNDVISGAFDVSPVIKRQKAHYQRIQAGAMGGGGKGKGKGKGGGYWNTSNAAAAAGGGAMGGGGGGGAPPHPLSGNTAAGGGGGLGQQQNLNYTASMGFVPQVMYSPQQMFAANQGMLSPHVMPATTTANPGGPIPPYLISMYGGYQQQQQQPQRSPSGGPGVSAAEVTRQLQQQQQRSAPQPAAASAATNNQYVQQQQAQQQPLNVPMSPQGVITPQQVMAVHQILRREHHHQQQQNQQAAPQEHGGAPETAATEANLNGDSAVEGGREEPS